MTEFSDFVLCPKCNEYFVATVSTKTQNVAATIALRVADAQTKNLRIKSINLAPWEYGMLRKHIMEVTGQEEKEVAVISEFMGYPVQLQQFIDKMFLELKY